MTNKNFLWTEVYRPQTINDCILPDEVKQTFNSFVEQGQIPNLMFAGTSGVGKTTLAKALCNELNASYIIINGSDEGRFLDTIRNKVKKFATTISLSSNASHKVVIIDEADNTTPDVQKSLRTFIEEYHTNCRFIFTCNYPNKIMEAIHSRCTFVEFRISPDDERKLQAQFFGRLTEILKVENINSDPKILAKAVRHYYPDWRRLLNECQRYSSNGELSPVIINETSDISIVQLTECLKKKEYTNVQKWVVDNLNQEPHKIFRKLYDSLSQQLLNKSVPELVLIIAKYQYQSEFVADHEINILACLTEVMISCEFK
jgi:DNA polymerase III delta prime subunit